MRLLHLYRPRLPGMRAQAIQVVHTAHALASIGFEVTLLADKAQGLAEADPLEALGLSPHPRLHLSIAPTVHPPTAGLWFRAQLTRWWMGAPGVVLARDKRRLVEATKILPARHRVVLETHELDSELARERGEDPTPWRSLEAAALGKADALVTNCEGTLRAWQQHHGAQLPPTMMTIHNATAPDRAVTHAPPARPVIRYMGSLRSVKGLTALLREAGPLQAPVEVVGASEEERAQPSPPGLHIRPPVPYTAIPDLLRTASAVLLPLQDNYFGHSLSSPLKLWDYLASTTPIIAADVPSIRDIMDLTGAPLHLYQPSQPDSVHHAVDAALAAPGRPAFLRTWMQRAHELAPILRGEP